jgi:transposase
VIAVDVYNNIMASLQARRVRGQTYWYIVESRRVHGKPRPIPLAYLGKADTLLARLQGTDPLQVHSAAHGAVAALWATAQALDVAGVIDRQLAATGRRRTRVARTRTTPTAHDGLTVGQTLTLIAIGRACHATSKRGFADWARTTTLGALAGTDVDRLTSQHCWDQMDQIPVASLASMERDLVGRVLTRLALPVDTLLFDATNFFTFIASTNARPTLAARGHNKQQRDDLRQVGVALLCARQGDLPLWHQAYGGQVADATCFAEVLPAVRQRLVDLALDVEGLTVVYDKGNVSRANQARVDAAALHYVTSVPAASQPALVTEANASFAPVALASGDAVQASRTRRVLWGADRTAVVVQSERLREGQMRGILQHVATTERWLAALADTLRRGRQRRDRARLQQDIDAHLRGRQHLRHVLHTQLTGTGRALTLTYQFDRDAFDALARDRLGRVVLITDRHNWHTAAIIQAYHGQAHVEAVFGHLKDPVHLALRPQFHWTDQKLHVHVFTCVLGYLLARTVFLQAQQTHAPYASMEALLDALDRVRRVTVARPASGGKGRVHLTAQLEDVDPTVAPVLAALGVTDALVYTPRS